MLLSCSEKATLNKYFLQVDKRLSNSAFKNSYEIFITIEHFEVCKLCPTLYQIINPGWHIIFAEGDLNHRTIECNSFIDGI